MPRRHRSVRKPEKSVDQAIKQLSISETTAQSDPNDERKSSVQSSESQSSNQTTSQTINEPSVAVVQQTVSAAATQPIKQPAKTTHQASTQLVKQPVKPPTKPSPSQSASKQSLKQVLKQSAKPKQSKDEVRTNTFELFGVLGYPEKAGVKHSVADEVKFFNTITQALMDTLKQKPLMLNDTVRVNKLIMTRGVPGDDKGPCLSVFITKVLTESEIDYACHHGPFQSDLSSRIRQVSRLEQDKSFAPVHSKEEDLFAVVLKSEYTVSRANNVYEWGAEGQDVTIFCRSVECLPGREAGWEKLLSQLNEFIAAFLPNYPIKDPSNRLAKRVALSNMDRHLCITLTFCFKFDYPSSEWCQTTLSTVCMLMVFARKAQLAKTPNDPASQRIVNDITQYMNRLMNVR